MNDRFLKLLCLLFFHTTFVYLDDGSGIGRVIQAICLGILMLLLFAKHKLKLYPQYKKINKYVVFYCVGLLLVSLYSKSWDIKALNQLNFGAVKDSLKTSSYTLGIMISMSIFTAFALVEYLSTINKTHILFEVFFKTLLFYIFISDIQFLIRGAANDDDYLIGNKFQLSYMHILCYVIYERISREKIKSKKIQRWLLILLSFVISIMTGCTTAILGMFAIFLLFSYENGIGKIVYKANSYFVVLSLGVLFMFFYNYVLDIPMIQKIIINCLHEDLTLTGRTTIFETLSIFMFASPMFGFGVGNAHWVLFYLFGYANAQNGVINLYLEEGLVGTILYFFVFIIIFKYAKQSKIKKVSFPILTYILVFFFLGLVEITIDNKLLIIMSFLLAHDSIKLPYAKSKYNSTDIQR